VSPTPSNVLRHSFAKQTDRHPERSLTRLLAPNAVEGPRGPSSCLDCPDLSHQEFFNELPTHHTSPTSATSTSTTSAVTPATSLASTFAVTHATSLAPTDPSSRPEAAGRSGEIPAFPPHDPYPYAITAYHSLAWLTFANAIGVLLAIMLLFPSTNRLFDTFTYGRWLTVHMNLELYGWLSLPLLAFLFKVYAVDRAPASQWARPILWIWSTALAFGALSWLTGHSSGKLFLDWTGYTRILFPLAITAVWLLLAYAFFRSLANSYQSRRARLGKTLGLALLLLVPILLYVAASPNLYPPINPATGGPTAASQLESTLIIIAILLLLPFGLTHRKHPRSRAIATSWIIFAAESLLCLGLGRADVSNHRPTQYIALGSLLIWIPLLPAYFAAFAWHPNTRRWRLAFLIWWAALVPTGWALFLPSVLDHFKFTDGLVGHSLLAMAGFATALLSFVLVQLLGDGGWIFNRTWSFYVWNLAVLAYVLLMFTAGWREGNDPAFTILPGTARNLIYTGRLIVGVLMFLASAEWLIAASQLLREPQFSHPTPPEVTS
jgi:cytochrome c oxidase cbb3-type subunit I